MNTWYAPLRMEDSKYLLKFIDACCDDVIILISDYSHHMFCSFTVPKKEALEFTREIGSKVDNNTLKTGIIICYIKNFQQRNY